MFRLKVEEGFAAAHFIKEYHGKCENLHGHNYKVFLYVEGDKPGKGGMLVDFGILKDVLRKVLKGLDHTLLNELPAFSEKEPSAEYIAEYIWLEVSKIMPDVRVSQVEVFETDKNSASFIPD